MISPTANYVGNHSLCHRLSMSICRTPRNQIHNWPHRPSNLALFPFASVATWTVQIGCVCLAVWGEHIARRENPRFSPSLLSNLSAYPSPEARLAKQSRQLGTVTRSNNGTFTFFHYLGTRFESGLRRCIWVSSLAILVFPIKSLLYLETGDPS